MARASHNADMAIHIVRLGSPLTPDEGLRVCKELAWLGAVGVQLPSDKP